MSTVKSLRELLDERNASPIRIGPPFIFPVATPAVPLDALQHGSKSGDDPRPVDAVGDDDLE